MSVKFNYVWFWGMWNFEQYHGPLDSVFIFTNLILAINLNRNSIAGQFVWSNHGDVTWIGVPKNPTNVWRRSLVSAFPNEVWCCLEDVGSIIAQGVPWSFDSTIWISLVGVKFGSSTWDDHENRYSNWTLCHPRIETRRIHVVGCWVKLCHRDVCWVIPKQLPLGRYQNQGL